MNASVEELVGFVDCLSSSDAYYFALFHILKWFVMQF